MIRNVNIGDTAILDRHSAASTSNVPSNAL